MTVSTEKRTRMQRAKGYDPEPMSVPPLFQSAAPPLGRPATMAKWFLTKYMWPQSITWIGLAALMYHVFTPSLGRFASLGIDDVGLLWLRNAVMMLVIIGGQHWWLHIRKAQGTEFKYESRWLAASRKSFTFNNQTRDNMFLSLIHI